MALSILKNYGIPQIINGLLVLEKDYPGISTLIDEVILFLNSMKQRGANAKPSEALKAAAAYFHKKNG